MVNELETDQLYSIFSIKTDIGSKNMTTTTATETLPIANRIRISKITAMGIASALALILSISVAVSIGAINIPISTVWGIIGNKIVPNLFEVTWNKGIENIVWEIRFPRVLLACLVGAGLSIVGASLQAVTRNPLADPHLLGISAGAAFGAILALLHTGLFIGLLTVPLLAFCGALGAMILIVSICNFTNGTSADRLILTGVSISFVIMAGANLLIFLGDPRATHTVVFWMLGGLGFAQWQHLIYPAIVLTIGGSFLVIKSLDLNAMTIGDESATTLGIPVQFFRMSIFVVGAFITAVMVAFSGMIGFVGLMIPHIVRMIFGGDNFRVIPASAIIGAIFLVWADVFSRKLMQPADMPIGILTGLIGGLFFIWLLRKRT